jgi:hypothetical protein
MLEEEFSSLGVGEVRRIKPHDLESRAGQGEGGDTDHPLTVPVESYLKNSVSPAR